MTSYDLRPVSLEVVRTLCEQHHVYNSAGKVATYAFAVFEDERPVAAYAWQPPPPGAAQAVCPEAPYGVLTLSRMVAIPKADRRLNHVSKPLRHQMSVLIDRTRWPVLVTYSDEGQGHTGHVYKCSGWEPTTRTKRHYYRDAEGKRASHWTSSTRRDLKRSGTTVLQRWEHWICERGRAAEWITANGWQRVAIPNRVWRSGNAAFTWKKEL